MSWTLLQRNVLNQKNVLAVMEAEVIKKIQLYRAIAIRGKYKAFICYQRFSIFLSAPVKTENGIAQQDNAQQNAGHGAILTTKHLMENSTTSKDNVIMFSPKECLIPIVSISLYRY